jgi:2-polyprenyl-3-methyl-5-hydroxy-6-metoxy-1,4-benzoquinol methylase
MNDSYDVFAKYYDRLTDNVDYSKRADYIIELLNKNSHDPGLTLDLACGTGSLTCELAKRNIDVYGVDSSQAMLSEANNKAHEEGLEILYICQNMHELDLYGTIDTVICNLDSINHLNDLSEIKETFKKVNLFLAPSGVFVFDFNTIKKHDVILANNVYIYDMEDIYCIWKNSIKINHIIDISLTFFERKGQLYKRSNVYFSEITFSIEQITNMLEETGFTSVKIFSDNSFENGTENDDKVIFYAKKD